MSKILQWYANGTRQPAEWLATPGVEHAEDVAFGEDGITLNRSLRVELLTPAGTVILRLRPLAPHRNGIKLWTSPETDRVDWFQGLNQRVQQYDKHLRQLPDMYRIAAWEQAELDAMAPTQLRECRLRPREWSTLVVTWQQTGTRAWIDGLPVAEAPGLLHKLLVCREAIQESQSMEGCGYWHRMLLLQGITLSHFALLDTALTEDQVLAVGEWQTPDALLDSIPASLHSGSPATRYAQATGIRLRGIDGEPNSAMQLELRHADRVHYWHYGAMNAIGGQCLYAIPDDTPIRWVFQATAAGNHQLYLHYQRLMPPPGVHPQATVMLDDQELGRINLPATTAGGPMRPEAEPFKPVPTGLACQLTPGWHTLTLTFHDNHFLALDEILLTTGDLALSTPDIGYVRPPFMEVVSLEETDVKTIYHLLFEGEVSGTLSIDDSSDPGPRPALSRAHLTGGKEHVQLIVPRDPHAPANQVRRLRIIFAEDQGRVRMPYHVRHRYPFARSQRPMILQPTWLDRSLPGSEERQTQLLASLRANPPPTDHHADAKLRRQVLIAWLSGEDADLRDLRELLLSIANGLVRKTFGMMDGEVRADVRSEYGGARRGSQFGEIWPEDAIAYDLLLSRGMLSSQDQLTIEGNLFWSGFENSKRHFGHDLSYRGQAHNVITAALAGVVLQDEPMLREAELGAIRFGAWQIRPDGGHNEKISSYGSSIKTLVDLATFLLDQGRPKVFETCRETIRAVCKVAVKGTFSNGALLRQGDGGLQASWHVFGFDQLLAAGIRLFPEDGELRQLQHTYELQGERLKAKWAHLPPAEWPELPDDCYRRSDLFPDSGWAILRSQPGDRNRLEASLDWSAFGDHGHPDKLNLGLLAFDEVVNMDLSYGWQAPEPRTQNYAMRTISHNTVVVDQQDQLPGGKGNLWLFEHRDDVQVCWADAGRCYPHGIEADRCLILIGDTLIDLFHLKAGRVHTFDWLFHSLGELTTNLDQQQRGPFCPPRLELERTSDSPGYDCLANLREGRTEGPIHAEWKLTGYHQMGWSSAKHRWLDYPMGTLHLDLPAAPDTTLITGDAPYPLPEADSRRPFAIVRRQAREVLFAAVYQARHDDSPPAAVTSLPVTLRGQTLAPHQAVALQVGDQLTVLQRHVNGPLNAGPIRDSFADLEIHFNHHTHSYRRF